MSMSVKGKNRVRSSSRVLEVIQANDDLKVQVEALATIDPINRPSGQADQNLHGAKFDAEPVPESDPALGEASPETPAEGNTNPLERKIAELLDQLGQGFQADDSTNFEKLTIARNYGPVLWDLKALVSHGEFLDKLKERFPKVNYAKCNRWMFIAKHEAEVAAAIEKYPDVAWGPKKMIDYLKEFWTPEEEAEDDEDDCFGNVREDHLKLEPLVPTQTETVEEVPEPDPTSPFAVGALNPELATAIKEHEQSSQGSPGATAGPVTQAVRTPPRNGKIKTTIRPAVNRTEYEVEVRIGFKLSVPDNVTAEDVTEAIRLANRWTLGINTPFDYEISEQGVVVGHVQPWGSVEQFQPEVVPGAEVAAQ